MDASLVIQTSRFVLTANHTISDLPPPSPSDEKRKPTTTLTVVVVKKSMLRRMKEKLGPTRAKLQTQDKNVLDNNGHLYGDISSSDLSGEAGVTYLNLPQLKVGVKFRTDRLVFSAPYLKFMVDTPTRMTVSTKHGGRLI